MVPVFYTFLIEMEMVVVFFYVLWRIHQRKFLSIEGNLFESFFVEIKFCNKKKWLISLISLIVSHFSALSKSIDIYTSKYDNLIFLGDFNPGRV